MSVNIPMNNKGYSGSGQGRNYIPYGDGVERFRVLHVVQKTNLRTTKNLISYGLECVETNRPDVVKVGRKYTHGTDLDVPGQYEEPGTPAFYAAQEVSQFTAATLYMTHEEACAAEIDLTEVLNGYLKRGEALAEDGIIIEIRSVDKAIVDKKTKEPILDDKGVQKHFTNRYFNPVQD